MKLLYATSIDLPSTRANRVQIVAMARAFHEALGAGFLLGLCALGPGYRLAVPHRLMPRHKSYRLALDYLRLAKREGATHLYCREERLLAFILLYNRLWYRLPLTIVYELHHLKYMRRWPYRPMLRRLPIVSITAAMRDVLVANGVPPDRILVAADAVDLAAFDIPMSRAEARAALALPAGVTIALYAGSIDEPWKGAHVFAAAAHDAPESLWVIVGGKPHYVEEFRRTHDLPANIRMVGHKEYETELPAYLKAADILVIPNSAEQELSRVATSPLKLFTYLAAGRPIIASDLPALREVLNDSNALLVPPDDPAALAAAARALAADPVRAAALAEAAHTEASRHTWHNRAEAILAFIA